ncbi:MAG: hypothetical protein JOZ39_08510 [Chloroflexi bacterium]|nr:hypothetical protein [Chloroflexota bacterium]
MADHKRGETPNATTHTNSRSRFGPSAGRLRRLSLVRTVNKRRYREHWLSLGHQQFGPGKLGRQRLG